MTEGRNHLQQSCHLCGALPKDDGVGRVNYAVFDCGTEVYEHRVSNPCREDALNTLGDGDAFHNVK